MMSIPAEIATRWSPMWACDFPRDRPWWRPNFSQHASHRVYQPPMWVRCDGRYGPPFDPHEDPERIRPQLALIDSAYPIPAPPLMPGQVWVLDGEELTVLSQTSQGGTCIVAGARLGHAAGGTLYECNREVYARTFATCGILVAGPSPWGRDVPWAPVAVTP